MKVNEMSVAQPSPVRTTNTRDESAATSGAGIARQVLAAQGNSLPPPEPTPAAQAPQSETNRLAESLARQLEQQTRQLNFSVDQDVDRMVVRVVDSSTGELVRQIPSEEFIELAKNLRNATEETLRGILLDGQA